MKILIYEDSGYKNLYPLNLLRASYDVKCGASSILKRIERIINNKFEISLHCRNHLAPYLREIHDLEINTITKDDYLLLNGRAIFSEDAVKSLLSGKEKNAYYTLNDEPVAAYVSKHKYQLIKDRAGSDKLFDKEFFASGKLKCNQLKNDLDIKLIDYSWNLIDYIIRGGLEDDFNYFLKLKENKRFKRVGSKDNFKDHRKIFVSKNAEISAQAVLDASGGRIVIDDGAKIEPFTFIKGPVYIGKNCLIKSGAKIYGPCVIGEYSKVAGEIAESIFHSYVNKQHDGFVGHSYICPFVNLGADTVTSDLKNNYSEIKVDFNGEEVKTGMQFLGSIIGDHSKTSINTMINTGSMIGIFANIFGGGFPSKTIESFSWNEAGKNSARYDIEKAIQTAKTVMDRRGIKISDAYEKVLRSYYSHS